jgi:hypothetical protein
MYMNDLREKSSMKDTKYLALPNDGVLIGPQTLKCGLSPTTCLHMMPHLLEMLLDVTSLANVHHIK